jgi:hypothetical protein
MDNVKEVCYCKDYDGFILNQLNATEMHFWGILTQMWLNIYLTHRITQIKYLRRLIL